MAASLIPLTRSCRSVIARRAALVSRFWLPAASVSARSFSTTVSEKPSFVSLGWRCSGNRRQACPLHLSHGSLPSPLEALSTSSRGRSQALCVTPVDGETPVRRTRPPLASHQSRKEAGRGRNDDDPRGRPHGKAWPMRCRSVGCFPSDGLHPRMWRKPSKAEQGPAAEDAIAPDPNEQPDVCRRASPGCAEDTGIVNVFMRVGAALPP